MTFHVKCDCVIDVQQVAYADEAAARAAAAERVTRHNCPCHVIRVGAVQPLATYQLDDMGEPIELQRGWDPRRTPGAPPSTYAVMAAIEGEAGAWPRLAGWTVGRTLFILPGLLVWNWLRPREQRASVLSLWLGSLCASATISGCLYIYYKAKLIMNAPAPQRIQPVQEPPGVT